MRSRQPRHKDQGVNLPLVNRRYGVNRLLHRDWFALDCVIRQPHPQSRRKILAIGRRNLEFSVFAAFNRFHDNLRCIRLIKLLVLTLGCV